jgi:peptidoglycan hydrolase CwlO-like protein
MRQKILSGIIAVAVVSLAVQSCSAKGAIDGKLLEYEQQIDKLLGMLENADEDDEKTIAKVTKLQQRIENLVNWLTKHGEEMTEEQLAEYLRITFKMTNVYDYY